MGSRPASTLSVVDGHLVEELEFQLLDRSDGTLLQGDKCETLASVYLAETGLLLQTA
jgi:hypothetical protein